VHEDRRQLGQRIRAAGQTVAELAAVDRLRLRAFAAQPKPVVDRVGSAVWALRTTGGFAEAIRAAIDLGGDTDTVAAITGGLAGAVYGIDAIPDHWRTPLFVTLPGRDSHHLTTDDLRHIAALLDEA
jgi:ADP-ribosylglycohydrolase